MVATQLGGLQLLLVVFNLSEGYHFRSVLVKQKDQSNTQRLFGVVVRTCIAPSVSPQGAGGHRASPRLQPNAAKRFEVSEAKGDKIMREASLDAPRLEAEQLDLLDSEDKSDEGLILRFRQCFI